MNASSVPASGVDRWVQFIDLGSGRTEVLILGSSNDVEARAEVDQLGLLVAVEHVTS